jgi:hypothetical protein
MKKTISVITAGILLLSMSITAFGGQWKHDGIGWWYQNDDGSFQQDGWFLDGDGKYYYFNQAGYMLADTVTPDGYYVNTDGAWVPGGQANISGGRDFTYASFIRTIPVLKFAETDYYNIYMGLRDAYIADLGDCYEVKNVRIYQPVEFTSAAAAQRTLDALRASDPDVYEDGTVRDSGFGTLIISGMDETRYSRLIWTGSIYVRKNAPIGYDEYNYDGNVTKKSVTLEEYLEQVEYRDFPFWDCVIRTIDSEGYVTSMTGAVWG